MIYKNGVRGKKTFGVGRFKAQESLEELEGVEDLGGLEVSKLQINLRMNIVRCTVWTIDEALGTVVVQEIV